MVAFVSGLGKTVLIYGFKLKPCEITFLYFDVKTSLMYFNFFEAFKFPDSIKTQDS